MVERHCLDLQQANIGQASHVEALRRKPKREEAKKGFGKFLKIFG